MSCTVRDVTRVQGRPRRASENAGNISRRPLPTFSLHSWLDSSCSRNRYYHNPQCAWWCSFYYSTGEEWGVLFTGDAGGNRRLMPANNYEETKRGGTKVDRNVREKKMLNT